MNSALRRAVPTRKAKAEWPYCRHWNPLSTTTDKAQLPWADDLDLDRIDHEIRIIELRAAAQEAAGGDMHVWENPDTPPEIHEQFWQNVLAYEQAEETTHLLQLQRAGVELPPPQELSDEQLTASFGKSFTPWPASYPSPAASSCLSAALA